MPDADGFTRPLPEIMAALTAEGQRRHTLVVARDRRNNDMLEALRDVESFEQRIARVDVQLETLFDERDRAVAKTRSAPAGGVT